MFGVADKQYFFHGIKKETSSLHLVTLLSAKKTIKRIELMSHSYFTRQLLNIKDKNITFQKNYLEEVKLNSVTCFIFKGILSYPPTQCQKCGLYSIQNFSNCYPKSFAPWYIFRIKEASLLLWSLSINIHLQNYHRRKELLHFFQHETCHCFRGSK